MEHRGGDDWFEELQPPSNEDEAEELLHGFAEVLSVLDEAELYLLHNRCIARQDGSDEQETILEIIEGQIALRRLRREVA